MPTHPHKGWHARGYLPHCDVPGLIQGITFRLHDSVPASVIAAWKEELGWIKEREPGGEDQFEEQRQELHRRLAIYEDAGHGECHLRKPEIAAIVAGALSFFDGERYSLQAWCLMPNHVHVLIRTHPGWPVGGVVHSWKRHTSRQANLLLGGSGTFWAPDYYDRFIRDEDHYWQAVRYIHWNPVKAKLCAAPEDWEWSSHRSTDLKSAPSVEPAEEEARTVA